MVSVFLGLCFINKVANDAGCWVLNTCYWRLASGFWQLAGGCLILVAGCFVSETTPKA
jgi:hypothetical protein